jgi:hypothetical protein
MKVKFSSRPSPGVITAPYPCPIIDEAGMISVKVKNLKKGGN